MLLLVAVGTTETRRLPNHCLTLILAAIPVRPLVKKFQVERMMPVMDVHGTTPVSPEALVSQQMEIHPPCGQGYSLWIDAHEPIK